MMPKKQHGTNIIIRRHVEIEFGCFVSLHFDYILTCFRIVVVCVQDTYLFNFVVIGVGRLFFELTHQMSWWWTLHETMFFKSTCHF
jgi:hypothetical protein